MFQKELFAEAPDSPPILSVYELTARIKDLLENAFPAVWVSGEISNLSRPQSGHCYLTLKDDRADPRRHFGAMRPSASASTCATAWK